MTQAGENTEPFNESGKSFYRYHDERSHVHVPCLA